MRINGNLVFNSDATGEIQHAYIERLASAPTFNSAQKGRIYFNTGSALYYYNDGSAWVPFATGGNAASLQSEVDAIEAAFGGLVNADGTYHASALTGSLANTVSLTDAIAKLQALADTTASGLATEITDRVAAVSAEAAAREAADTAEATARQSADDALQVAIDAEASRATAAESVLTANLASEVTRATTAEGTLTTNLASEVARAQNAEAILTTDLASEVTRATAAEATLTSAIAAEQTRAEGAEGALQDAIDAEVARATAADAQHTADIAAETAARQAADQAHDTAIENEVARATARENQLEADFNARVQGLSWKNPVRVASTANIADLTAVTEVDGVTLADGDRVLLKDQTNQTENGIYVFTLATTTLARASDMDVAAEFDAATFYVREGSTQADLGFTQTAEVAVLGTDNVHFVQFNGAGSVTAGDGMTQVGNVINVGAADSSITVGPDNIKVSDALQTAISQNTLNIAAEVTRATAKENLLDAAIQQEASDRAAAVSAETAARIADVDLEEARAIAAEADLQDQLNAEVLRATAAEGVIATNLAQEISDRTAAVAAVNSAITAETTRATAAEDTLTTNLAAEVTRATAAEDAIAADVSALESKVGKMYFLYSAGSPLTSHTVGHMLGQKYCNVTIVDDTDNVVIPQSIVFDSANQLTVTFTTALQCKVIVMGLA